MQPNGPLQGVGKTALGVALVRARESQRDDRLFEDLYAQAFVDAAPGAVSRGPEVRGAAGRLGAAGSGVLRPRRHSYAVFDDCLTAAATAGCRQAVLLADGLDTRAFRLAWPERMRVFELDLPDVLVFKDTVLAARHAVPRCKRITVPADLRGGWTATLTEAGFDRTAPAAWLAEGLLHYLTADEAGRLLTGVSELSAAGSQLSFEHSPMTIATLTAQAQQMPAMQQYTSLRKGGLGDDALGWLTGHGWQPEFYELAALAASCRRPIPDSARGGFLTAVRMRS